MGTNSNVKVFTWIKPLEPYPDESLASFLARWARANALTSRLGLVNALDVSRAIRLFPSDLQKLASLLQLRLPVLESIAASSDPRIPALRRAHIRPSTESFCPQCLEEALYSRQLWSHCLATACSTHGTRLLDRCQRCGNSIRHDRPLPHICDCGADLRRQDTVEATSAEVEFSNLLVGVTPVDAKLPFNLGNGIAPDFDLFMIGMAHHFASDSTGRILSQTGKTPLPMTIELSVKRLRPVFDLLEDWPYKFDQRLKEMIEAAPTVTTGAAAKLGRWYFFLFRRFPHVAFEPLRVAAANRIVTSHDGVLNARTRCVQSVATIQKNWFSAVEAGFLLGMRAERIQDGIDRGLIKARVHDESVSYRQRFIPFDEVERLKRLQIEHINIKSAIEILQVSKPVFTLLCDSGWIARSDPNRIAPVVSGYIQRAPLMELVDRLRTMALAGGNRRIGAFVRLKDLNMRRTTDRKRLINLFRSIASGELQPIGYDESLSVGGLMFSQTEVDKQIASWFVVRGLTAKQVAVLTGAHKDAVLAWVEMGILPATRKPLEQGEPWVIDLRDFTSFLQTYTPLALQAKACNTSSRWLSRGLERLGVKTIAPVGGRGALLRIPDLLNALKSFDTVDSHLSKDT